MPRSSPGELWQRKNVFQFSIGDALLSRLETAFLSVMFQFSIGDAADRDVGRLYRRLCRKVSILYWRCGSVEPTYSPA